MNPLRVATWNLRHGGGNLRTPEQALFLAGLSLDVVALCELRPARGAQLLAMLADAGLCHTLWQRGGDDHANRVCIASREPLHETHLEGLRFVRACAQGITLIAAHVPDSSAPSERARCWQRVLHHARAAREQHAIVLGDFNTARRGVDRGLSDPGADACARWIGTLATLGYADAWLDARSRPEAPEAPAPSPPSWIGPRGERRRIDAVWCSASLRPALRGAGYTACRVASGTSDHELCWAELRPRTRMDAGPESEASSARPVAGRETIKTGLKTVLDPRNDACPAVKTREMCRENGGSTEKRAEFGAFWCAPDLLTEASADTPTHRKARVEPGFLGENPKSLRR